MPRILKSGLAGSQAAKLVENIDDNYLEIVEHASLIFLIEKYMPNKSRTNKTLSFVALACAWEYVVSQLISGERVGGDS